MPGANRSLKRWVLACLSLSLALAIAWPVVHFAGRARKSPRPTAYGLQLVDEDDRPLGRVHGDLKLLFDPFVVYRIAPNQKSACFSIHAFGGRGQPPVFQKNSHANTQIKHQLIVLGGSAAFGQELARDDDTFPAQMQRKMTEYAVWNFAAPGYFSGQELGFFLHRLRWISSPVVLAFNGWNEAFDIVQGAPRRHEMYGFNGQFFEVRDRLAEWHASGVSASRLPPTIDEEDRYTTMKQVYFANILDLRDLAKARGGRLLWVMQPELGAREDSPESEKTMLASWSNHYGFSPQKLTAVYRRLRDDAARFARENSIAFLDVHSHSTWQANNLAKSHAAPQSDAAHHVPVGSGSVLFADPVHPNAAGHLRLAELLSEWIGDLGIRPEVRPTKVSSRPSTARMAVGQEGSADDRRLDALSAHIAYGAGTWGKNE